MIVSGGRRATILFFSVLVLGILPSPGFLVGGLDFEHGPLQREAAGADRNPIQALPKLGGIAAQSSNSATTYDEQLGISFTQDFYSLSYDVIAVEQSGADGYGPAYLLNGLTPSGYWYQVGLSWNWCGPSPGGCSGYSPGFNFAYEVFGASGKSIFPASGGGGNTPFSGQVSQGDTVLLNLVFSTDKVVMSADDQNRSASASVTYSAEGSTYFAGTPAAVSDSNGFFTGLMTEWYHSSPYYGNEAKVVYTANGSPISDAWLWIDEFNPDNRSQTVFDDHTTSPVSFASPDALRGFSSNGATEYANAKEFITGPQTNVPLTLSFTVVFGDSTPLAPPTLTYVTNNMSVTVPLTSIPTTYFADIGSPWSVTNPLSGSGPEERWMTNQTTSGTASLPQSIEYQYFDQFLMTVRYSVVGGGSDHPPTLVAEVFGSQKSITVDSGQVALWVDNAFPYSISGLLLGSGARERWATNSTLIGAISITNRTVLVAYYHQYLVNASYVIVGGGNPEAPNFSSKAFGVSFSRPLNLSSPFASPKEFWVDASSPYSITNPITTPSNLERWQSNSSILDGSVSTSPNFVVKFNHQYHVSVQANTEIGGTVSAMNGWLDSATALQVNASVNQGWEFEGWNGTGASGYSGQSAVPLLTIGSSVNETAVFYPGLFITVPNGIQVSYQFGSASYSITGTIRHYVPPGTEVTFTASPTSFIYSFGGWQGSQTSSESVLSVVVNSPTSLTATSSLNIVNVSIVTVVIAAIAALSAVLLGRRSRTESH